jgi:glyoxalase family protein
MRDAIPGIHHVTAICSDAQRNIDFYCNVLGLRLVKLTVNSMIPAPIICIMAMSWDAPVRFSLSSPGPAHDGDAMEPGRSMSPRFSVPADSLSYWQGVCRSTASKPSRLRALAKPC